MPSIFLHVDGCRKIIDKNKYFKKKPDAKALALIGSVIPDLELFGVLPEVHGRCKEFYDYLKVQDKEYLPLAFGMVIHEHHDNIIETHFVGDNEDSARKLIKKYDEELSKIGTAPEILIEHSMDCSLVEAKPELINFTASITKKIKRGQIKRIAEHLANFFGGNGKEIAKAIRMFKRFNFNQYASVNNQHELWQRYMFLLSQNKNLKENQLKGKLISMQLKIAINFLYGKKKLKEKKAGMKEMFLKAKKKFNHNSMLNHVDITEEKLSKLPFELL